MAGYFVTEGTNLHHLSSSPSSSTFTSANNNGTHQFDVGGQVHDHWSSLACHPIMDDDVQSAWQIISNLHRSLSSI